jgi:aryl-alcohol dehydrogenase-like predicted oxidoreductase
MQYTTLGRTGLKVSVAGLGCGGSSRLGLGRGGKAHASNMVRAALDLGINLIDNARGYGTEEAVGDALAGIPRESYVLTTKHLTVVDGRSLSPDEVVAGFHRSLRELRTDYVDVFFIHGLNIARWDHAIGEILPALLREKEKGRFRFLAMSESPNQEPMHDATVKGLDEDLFDVIMLAFSLVNQNARDLVFPRSIKQKVATLLMFVVRDIFSHPEMLRDTIAKLAAEGKVSADLAGKDNPLDFLIHANGGAANILDAAYRYGRHEPGADVVLFGTGSVDHMKSNIASILAPALPEADRAKVRELFGHLVGVGLENWRNK